MILSRTETLTGAILDRIASSMVRGMGIAARSPSTTGQPPAETAQTSGPLILAMNPISGRLSTAKGRQEVLRDLSEVDSNDPPPYTLLYSRYPGHLRQLVDEVCRDGWERRVPVTIGSCGGDGTHAEVLDSAERWAARGLQVSIYRWPLGTGNDAADAENVRALLGRLKVREASVGVEAVSVTTRRGEVRRAYNIASLGVDAFITDLTNRLRHLVPGNIYKHVADVSVLFYEQLVGVGPMRVHVEGAGGGKLLEGRFMLLAVGAGAPRTYGNHMRVLPDERNLCAIERGHIGRKVVMKRRFYAGRHVLDSRTHMAEARTVRVEYGRRVPAQFDGEAIWLSKEDFPLQFRIEPGWVQVLPRTTS